MHGLIKAEDADKASDDMIATTTLAEMDGNEDGKISLQEYITACLGKEEFSKMLTLKIIDIFVDEENVEEKGEPAEQVESTKHSTVVYILKSTTDYSIH